MNEYELAEIIQHLENAKYIGASKAATMLRQQQAEIEALKLGDIQWSHAFDLAKIEIADLKAENSHLKYEISSGAWNPVKRELTDEKILNLWWDSDHTKDEDDLILTFVKRILKER